MKKMLLILPLILLMGCTNEVEENKYAYLTYKSELQEQEVLDEEVADFNTFFNIERENEEVINYSLIIDNPNINMYNIKALLIHDYSLQEAYPSSGIMDDAQDLLKDSKDKIKLEGIIQTVEDIKGVKFKLYLEYTDDNGDVNKIYYQVSRG